LIIRLAHADGIMEEFPVNHTYNENQIEWFKYGSALNLIKAENAK
jgi:aconitate hydratase